MKIISKVNDAGYIQWLERFVEQIIHRAKIVCEEVIIKDIEYSRNICLDIDGEEYDIRTWDFNPVKKDEQDRACAEMVDYTLFKTVKDDTGSHGEEVCNGSFRIEWKN